MATNSHNMLLHRTFQWMAVIAVLTVLGGGYWYWKNAWAAAEMDDNRPSFEAPLTHDLNLTAGQGSPTYSRADGANRRATVTDFEGLIRPVKSDEARFEGARRVENLLATTSEDFSNAAWSNSSVSLASGIADSQGGTAAIRMTTTGANGFISKNAGGTTGRIYTHSIWIRRVSGSGNVILHGNTIGETVITSQVTTSWQRFSNTFTETDGNTYAGLRLGTSGDVVDVAFAQMEEVTGQANQNPSEYVSVGVKTASPYHGAGVDGVKYFDTENGNTVASNIVTEATGTTIATATLKGYLSEGTRTNLLLRSEEADAVNWSKSDSTITANASVSPGGKTDADLVTEGTAGGASVGQATTVSASTSYVFSTYLKRGSHDWVRVVMYQASDTNNQFRVWANLATGALGTGSATGTGTYASSSIRSVGNGWYRVSVVGTLPGTDAIVATISATADNSGTRVGGSTRYVWGAQLEQASFASSYIPTTSASVARALDSLRYPETGNFNDTTGSVSLETTPNWTGGLGWNAHWVADSSSGVKLRIWHWTGSANHTGVDRSANNGATRNQIDPSLTLTQGTMIKIAAKWDGTALRQFNNGALAGSDTTLTLPYDSLANSLYIGSNNTTDHAFSSIRNVRAWKKALTDTELNSLTSLTQATSDSAIKETTVKAPDNTGLVGYWSFEDGSGTKAEDFSASGTNTGTLTNMEAGDWVDGKFGKALAFDGVNEYVNVPNTTSLNPGTGNFTISAWIRVDSTPTDFRRLINKGAGSNYYAFVKFPGDKWKFELRDGTLSTGDLDFGASTMTYGNWTHLVATVDQGNSLTSGYLDGVLKDTSSIAGYATVSNTDYLSLGRSSIDAPYAIDDVRIYDRALSQAEVADLYRSGSATKLNASQNNQLTSGLVGLWSFNGPDLSGTTAYDRSGQGNDGTLTNGPTAAIGKVGQALNFDGTNEHVNIASMSGLPSTAITVSAWIRPAGLKNWGHVAYHEWVASNGSWLFFTDALGRAIFGVYDNATQYTSILSGLTIGNWHHVVGTYDGSNVIVYIDGVPGSIKPLSGVTLDSVGQVTISNTGAASSFNGSIDEVRIYDHALTQAEISALYSAGR